MCHYYWEVQLHVLVVYPHIAWVRGLKAGGCYCSLGVLEESGTKMKEKCTCCVLCWGKIAIGGGIDLFILVCV